MLYTLSTNLRPYARALAAPEKAAEGGAPFGSDVAILEHTERPRSTKGACRGPASGLFAPRGQHCVCGGPGSLSAQKPSSDQEPPAGHSHVCEAGHISRYTPWAASPLAVHPHVTERRTPFRDTQPGRSSPPAIVLPLSLRRRTGSAPDDRSSDRCSWHRAHGRRPRRELTLVAGIKSVGGGTRYSA